MGYGDLEHPLPCNAMKILRCLFFGHVWPQEVSVTRTCSKDLCQEWRHSECQHCGRTRDELSWSQLKPDQENSQSKGVGISADPSFPSH